MANGAAINRAKRFAPLLLAVALAVFFALPATIYAQETEKPADSAATESAESAESTDNVVRVGWFESPFNITDQFGRRSGYAYEYQRKLAAYTGWTYEYVEGTWPELMKMLEEGKIDLMSDVSFKADRADRMLYASLPMGTEAYYIFTSSDETDIAPGHYETLNGKKVGVTANSIQQDLFTDWAKAHGIQVDLVALANSEEESLAMLQDGSLDAFVTLDAYADPEKTMPVSKIGSSEFYFAVNKDRPDLLNELDAAMNRIQDEDRYYNQQMQERYLSNAGANLYLSVDELEWLADHGTIRVGYQDNYLAFCAADEVTGELTGALKDYLVYASTGLANADLDFEAVAYPTAAAALEALANGEVDCMFPANLSDYDGENLGVVMTPPLMRTEMDAVVRASDQKEFILKKNVAVAVNEGNTNYEMFLLDNFPGWQVVYFPDTPTGLEGVAEGKADCVIISNYRFSNISKLCEKLHLATVYTGVDMDYYLAVREGDSELYSILSRVTDMMPESVTHAALTYYSTEDVKVSFGDFVKDNLFIVMSVIVVVLLIILVLLLRSIRMERKVREEEQIVNVLNERVFVDPLTSLRNKGAYDEHIHALQERLDDGEQLEFAIGVFDCDNLKMINDRFGHDKGDVYLQVASHLICRVFKQCPVFRIGGDEFAAILQNDDYENRVDLIDRFDRAQEEICASAVYQWEEVHVSAGIAVYNPEHDAAVSDTVRRADKIMYENKRMGKRAWMAASESDPASESTAAPNTRG